MYQCSPESPPLKKSCESHTTKKPIYSPRQDEKMEKEKKMPDLTQRGNSNVLGKSFVDWDIVAYWYNTSRPVLARREVLVRYCIIVS